MAGGDGDVGYDIDVDGAADGGGGDGWINRAPTLFTDITSEHAAAPSAAPGIGLVIADAADGNDARAQSQSQEGTSGEDEDDVRDEHRDDDGTLDGIARVVESTARVLDKSLEDFQNMSFESPTKSNNANGGSVDDDVDEDSIHDSDGPTFPSIPTKVEFEKSDDDFIGDVLDRRGASESPRSDRTEEGPGYTDFDSEPDQGEADLDVTDTDHSGYYSGSQAILVRVSSAFESGEVSTLDGEGSTLEGSRRASSPTYGELAVRRSSRSGSSGTPISPLKDGTEAVPLYPRGESDGTGEGMVEGDDEERAASTPTMRNRTRVDAGRNATVVASSLSDIVGNGTERSWKENHTIDVESTGSEAANGVALLEEGRGDGSSFPMKPREGDALHAIGRGEDAIFVAAPDVPADASTLPWHKRKRLACLLLLSISAILAIAVALGASSAARDGDDGTDGDDGDNLSAPDLSSSNPPARAPSSSRPAGTSRPTSRPTAMQSPAEPHQTTHHPPTMAPTAAPSPPPSLSSHPTNTCYWVDVTVVFDSRPWETSWDMRRIHGAADSDPMLLEAYRGAEGEMIREESMCLSEGDYMFTIYDDGGDGLTSNPTGRYNVTTYGLLIARGDGDFGYAETTRFTLHGSVMALIRDEPLLR